MNRLVGPLLKRPNKKPLQNRVFRPQSRLIIHPTTGPSGPEDRIFWGWIYLGFKRGSKNESWKKRSSVGVGVSFGALPDPAEAAILAIVLVAVAGAKPTPMPRGRRRLYRGRPAARSQPSHFFKSVTIFGQKP